MHVGPQDVGSVATWIEVGSIKPENAGDPVWVRSKATALALREKLNPIIGWLIEHGIKPSTTGLIISFEAPTPQNDFLTSISRILHVVLLDKDGPAQDFAQVNIQLTNAATLRRLMGLVQRGRDNKKENVAKAFTYLDKGSFPNLDTNACDASLMAIMARYTAAILMGLPHTVPERFLIAFEAVGKGTSKGTRTKGGEGMSKC